jgi:hypothetical protein
VLGYTIVSTGAILPQKYQGFLLSYFLKVSNKVSILKFDAIINSSISFAILINYG